MFIPCHFDATKLFDSRLANESMRNDENEFEIQLGDIKQFYIPVFRYLLESK